MNLANDRENITKVNNYGEKMTIIKYRNCRDVDIKFEDGTIAKHRQYNAFVRGTVINPKYANASSYRAMEYAKKRLGNTSKASNGQIMTIVAYRNADDIDVKFEDGTIVEHKSYANFLNGKIENPNMSLHSSDSLNEFAIYFYLKDCGFARGKQHMLEDLGFGAREIDIYNPNTKIGIEYDGNNWHKNLKQDKEKDLLCKKNDITLIRVREPGLPSIKTSRVFNLEDDSQLGSSLENTIREIGAFLGLSLDVDFNRDKEKIYDEYNVAYQNIIGRTKIANNGLSMKIIAFRRNNDIDVEFENGTIVERKRLSNFNRGDIACPNYRKTLSNLHINRIGEENTSNEGKLMRIVAYRSSRSIDILFVESGVIAKNRDYFSFLNGKIAMREDTHVLKDSRVGETSMSAKNEKMVIVNYRSATDIDVKFEDGTVVEHRSYLFFKQGKIKNPNYFRNLHKGKVNYNTKGHRMVIIDARSYNDIDIKFENGVILYHRSMKEFENGYVTMPAV